MGIGYVTLDFINEHTNSLAYFEYRIDGQIKTSGTNHPNPCKISANPLSGVCNGLRYIDDNEYIYSGVSVDTRPAGDGPLTVPRTINATNFVEVRLALGGERSWDFDWTRFDVLPNPDPDDDGVLGEADLCLETTVDSITEDLGTNRWIWDGDSWETEKSKGKGPTFLPTMEYTKGCSCTQILDKMVDATGADFGGHYKFGCSQSVLNDWNSGVYKVESSLVIPSDNPAGVSTISLLKSGYDYLVNVWGTWQNRFGLDPIQYPPQWIDAEYLSYDSAWGSHQDGHDGGLINLPDLQINQNFVDWGVYNSDHKYSRIVAGNDSVLNLRIYDGLSVIDPSWYTDNEGELYADVLVKLY